MSNKGKFLYEMKKVGAVVKKSAGEVGSAIGEAATNLSAHAKTVAKIAVLKAEMDAIYLDLGKSVFEDGLMPDNETAWNLMNVLFEKSAELDALEKLVKDDNVVNEKHCDCGESCTCDETCECEETCTCEEQVEDTEPTPTVEIPTEDDTETKAE